MKQTRTEVDWFSLLLVATLVTVAVWAIVAADWTEGLTVLWIISLGGVGAGLALAKSSFRPWIAHCFSAVYCLGWGAYWLSRQIETADTFRERLLEIDRRLGVWLWQVTHNEVSRDSLVFILLLALLVWWIGYFAVWYSQRFNRVWRVVLPSGLLLFANVYYAGTALNLYFGLYLLAALLVVTRSYTTNQEQHWRQNLVGYTTDFRFDLLQAGFTLAIVAILLGWGIPAAASSEQAAQIWERVEGPWRTVEDTWNRLFSSLRSRRPIYADPFGRFLTLQGARFVTETPILDIRSSEASYWRATAFNHYTGSGWIATDVRAITMDNQERIYRDDVELRHPVTQTVTILRPSISLVFAAPQPQRASIPVRVEGWSPSDYILDPAMVWAKRTFAQGSSYIVISSVSHADVASLRNAGQDYPAWVREHYLELPATLPQRVRDLAQEIAAPFDIPYDKADALERWMRENITYDDQIKGPPQERDVVDYLLFDSRRGYCDYYASAMTVMARAVGIPARTVAGYAQGKFDNGIYHIQDKDSHSWVEIYFPKYGWVEFEPTASQAAIERPTPAPTPTPARPADGTPVTPSGTRPARPDRDMEDPDPLGLGGGGGYRPTKISPWLVGGVFAIGIVFLAVALALAWAGFDSWSLNPVEVILLLASISKTQDHSTLHNPSTAQRAYSRLMRLADWLKVTLSAHHTPHERGRLFIATVPEGNQPITTIVDNYVREQYGRATSAGADSRLAWESVRAWVLRAGLRQRQETIAGFFRRQIAILRNFSSRFE